MSTAQSTCVVGHAIVGDNSVTAQELEDAIENKTDGDFDRSHVKSSSTIPGIGTTEPQTPPALQTAELWVDPTDPLDTGTTKTHILKTFNGSAFRAGVVAWDVDTATPDYTAGRGMGWWDATLKIFRIYSTIDGITGWHPTDRGVRLMTNGEASDAVAKGAPVIQKSASTGNFVMTPTMKDMGVIGVALEAITAGSDGLIAMLGSGMEVSVLCDSTEAHDTIAAGDYICTYSADGEARGLGPQVTDPNIGVASTIDGTPCGAFAIALGTQDTGGTELTLCRLLDQAGRGAWVHIPPEVVMEIGDFAVSASWAENDMTSHLAGAASILTDVGHAPILAVGLDVDLRHGTTDNNSANITVDIGPDRTSTRKIYLKGPTSNNLNASQAIIVVPTKSNNADSNASLGNFIQVKMTETVETLDVGNLIATKYLF